MCLFTSHNKRVYGSFAVLTLPKCHRQAFISMRYYLLMIGGGGTSDTRQKLSEMPAVVFKKYNGRL